MLVGKIICWHQICILLVIKHRVATLSEALEKVTYGADVLLLNIVKCCEAVEIRVLDQFVVEEQLFGQVFECRVDGRLVNLVQV